MTPSNHSWNAHDRPTLHVTPSGIQLLAYLDYVTVHHFVSLAATDTAVPPEQYDLDRPAETELERLYREMDEALEAMRQAGRNDDDAFIAARARHAALKTRIYHLENEIPFQDDDDDDPAAADDIDDEYDDNTIPDLQGNGGDDMDDDDGFEYGHDGSHRADFGNDSYDDAEIEED